MKGRSLKTKNQNLIIEKITGISKTELFLNPKIDTKFEEEINLANKRLKQWEPIEYIINNVVFYWVDFYIDNRVLIPRNDTEVMVYETINEITKYSKITLIDVWTWSSCIAISVLKNIDTIYNCYVIDICKDALSISKKNIIKYNFEKKIKQIKSDLIKAFLIKNNFKLNKNIIITSNLPYIKNWDIKNIDKETLQFEPNLALYWWKNTGFEVYERLIKEVISLKETTDNNIILFIEIGFDQEIFSKDYLNNLNLRFKKFNDNNWICRCLKINF